MTANSTFPPFPPAPYGPVQTDVTRWGLAPTEQEVRAYESKFQIAPTQLTAAGTRDTTTFLRGDGTWAVSPGGGGITRAEADTLYKAISYNPTWANISGKPTTLAGFGISDAAAADHKHVIADIIATGTPSSTTFLRGDGAWAAVSAGSGSGLTQAQADLLYKAISYSPAWTDISNRPTTLAGFGISDAAPLVHTHTVAGISASGTRDSTTFLRGDGAWAVPSGGSSSSGVGTAGKLVKWSNTSGGLADSLVSDTGTAVQINGDPGGTETLRVNGSARVSGNAVLSGTTNCKAITEILATPAISAGALTLDLSLANTFRVSVSSAISTLTITNPAGSGVVQSFTLILDYTGNFGVTWPASIKWPGGVAATPTASAGKSDVYTFVSTTGGTNWMAFVAGQGF